MAIKGDIINASLIYHVFNWKIRVIVLVNGPELMIMKNIYAK